MIKGVDGIRNKLPCPPAKDENAAKLPSTLEETLEVLQDDHVICDALGQQFVDWFVQSKKDLEISKLQNLEDPQLLDKERDMYIHL